MTLRTTSKVITFVHPFALPGLDHAQPSGAYTVPTDEEPIEGLSFLAYRRVATLIFLPLHPGNRDPFRRSVLHREISRWRWPGTVQHRRTADRLESAIS
jgi:hypothetical protein